MSIGAGSSRTSSPTATSCRSASTSSPTWRAEVAVTDDAATGASEQASEPPRQAKSLTIGAVCKALQTEFQDISISKIRYLEDQKLITPRRTPGGYRLYSAADVARLRTILRLQRDEYMPLAVIRQELASGRTVDASDDAPAKAHAPPSAPATARPPRPTGGRRPRGTSRWPRGPAGSPTRSTSSSRRPGRRCA